MSIELIAHRSRVRTLPALSSLLPALQAVLVRASSNDTCALLVLLVATTSGCWSWALPRRETFSIRRTCLRGRKEASFPRKPPVALVKSHQHGAWRFSCYCNSPSTPRKTGKKTLQELSKPSRCAYLSVDLHRGHILKATWPPRALILHLFLLPFACRHTEQSNQPHTADTSVPDILPWQCNNRA